MIGVNTGPAPASASGTIGGGSIASSLNDELVHQLDLDFLRLDAIILENVQGCNECVEGRQIPFGNHPFRLEAWQASPRRLFLFAAVATWVADTLDEAKAVLGRRAALKAHVGER